MINTYIKTYIFSDVTGLKSIFGWGLTKQPNQLLLCYYQQSPKNGIFFINLLEFERILWLCSMKVFIPCVTRDESMTHGTESWSFTLGLTYQRDQRLKKGCSVSRYHRIKNEEIRSISTRTKVKVADNLAKTTNFCSYLLVLATTRILH